MSKAVSILADILANSMEHFEDIFEFTENLSDNNIPIKNEADLWLQYWELDALERAEPSFDWEGWIVEKGFIMSEEEKEEESKKPKLFVVDGYKIWAKSQEEAEEHHKTISKF